MDTDDAQRAHNDLIAQHRARPADDRSPEQRTYDDAVRAVARARTVWDDAIDAADRALVARNTARDAWIDAGTQRDAAARALRDA